jgi:hypothetical protein
VVTVHGCDHVAPHVGLALGTHLTVLSKCLCDGSTDNEGLLCCILAPWPQMKYAVWPKSVQRVARVEHRWDTIDVRELLGSIHLVHCLTVLQRFHPRHSGPEVVSSPQGPPDLFGGDDSWRHPHCCPHSSLGPIGQKQSGKADKASSLELTQCVQRARQETMFHAFELSTNCPHYVHEMSTLVHDARFCSCMIFKASPLRHRVLCSQRAHVHEIITHYNDVVNSVKSSPWVQISCKNCTGSLDSEKLTAAVQNSERHNAHFVRDISPASIKPLGLFRVEDVSNFWEQGPAGCVLGKIRQCQPL